MDSTMGFGQARPAFHLSLRSFMPTEENQAYVRSFLKHVPQRVRMILATFMGMAIAFAMVLSVTGLQIPFNRIVEAYAKRIESTVSRLEVATDDMAVIASRIEASENNLKLLGNGFDRLSSGQERLKAEVTAITKQLKELDSRVRILEHGVREAKK